MGRNREQCLSMHPGLSGHRTSRCLGLWELAAPVMSERAAPAACTYMPRVVRSDRREGRTPAGTDPAQGSMIPAVPPGSGASFSLPSPARKLPSISLHYTDCLVDLLLVGPARLWRESARHGGADCANAQRAAEHYRRFGFKASTKHLKRAQRCGFAFAQEYYRARTCACWEWASNVPAYRQGFTHGTRGCGKQLTSYDHKDRTRYQVYIGPQPCPNCCCAAVQLPPRCLLPSPLP